MRDSRIQATLRQNLAAVEERLDAACCRAGRSRSEVTLVAVTKTVSAEVAACLPELGVSHLGENRPQELCRKAETLPSGIHWHMIGHLQRNKIDRVLPLVALIHSVDSIRLLQSLEQEAGKRGQPVPVLLEMNTSGEKSKQGFTPADLPALAKALRELRHVQAKGLMTMAALQEPEACRPSFALLRTLRDRVRSEVGLPHTLEHLSMGMSNDFEVAVEEGATYIRLGTVLYEGVTGEPA
jgi:pyridoxal phosphate enzyme (YggS family)